MSSEYLCAVYLSAFGVWYQHRICINKVDIQRYDVSTSLTLDTSSGVARDPGAVQEIAAPNATQDSAKGGNITGDVGANPPAAGGQGGLGT